MTERSLHLAAGSVLDAPAHQVVDAAAAAGFAGVGLRVSGEHGLSQPETARLRRRIDDLGLVVSDVEVVRIGDPNCDPPAVIECAASLGAAWVLVVSDLPDVVATRDSLAELAHRARVAGVRIGLEYMAWTTPSSPGLAADLAKECGVGVVCDLLHHHRVGATGDDLDILTRAGVLGWVQICDAPFAAPAGGVPALLHEARHERKPPGRGGLPGAELLSRVPVDIPLSVEVQSDALRRSLPVAARVRMLHEAAQRWNTIGYRPK